MSETHAGARRQLFSFSGKVTSVEPSRALATHLSMKNRSRIDILADILLVALHGASKTQIMYKANLSHKVADQYVAYLTKIGLMQTYMEGPQPLQNGRGTTYRTTQKGTRFLLRFAQMQALLDEELVLA
ncbi:MAG: winged helix-turn-helix domain-containing protein [Candidatus Bathyarchaeia archaeon]